jgi:uroporphyrinogen III methyltransferase/synthase
LTRSTLFVTRPAQDAAPLIDALRARGHTVVALPVLAIEAVDDPSRLIGTMARIDEHRLAVFVSPNAIRQALAHRDGPWPRGTTIGVMGPGSVETLKGFGIGAPHHRVVSPAAGAAAGHGKGDRFDSEALFAALDLEIGLSRGFEGRALILKGNGGRAWFADRLRALGIAVDEVEAYRRVRPDADAVATHALKRLVDAREPATFILTSSEGVANLVDIVGHALAGDAARTWLLGSRILAPHRRIAEKARDTGFSDVSVCAPGDRGILAAIE